jgi:protein SCO1/2
MAMAAITTGDGVPDVQAALRMSQQRLGATVGDYRLATADGRTASLADYRGQPLVVNLVYTACASTCPIIVQTLANAVADAQSALGKDRFRVITIGFDTEHDTPTRMRSFARAQGITLPNWTFAAMASRDMDGLSADLGFTSFASAKGFDHVAQVSVLDAEGRVYRHIYGDGFDSPFLVEPLKDLVFGRSASFTSIDGLVNQLRLFCTLYDPAAGRYRFDYSIFIGFVVGLGALATIGFVVVRNVIRLTRSGSRDGQGHHA